MLTFAYPFLFFQIGLLEEEAVAVVVAVVVVASTIAQFPPMRLWPQVTHHHFEIESVATMIIEEGVVAWAEGGGAAEEEGDVVAGVEASPRPREARAPLTPSIDSH